MKILGISGSPRKKATDAAVRWVLDYAGNKYGAETFYFSVRAKKINFCIHCDYCIRKRNGCIHQDHVQELYPHMQSSQVWILGSPVYHGHISAQLKAILDRTRALMAEDKKVFYHKLGMGVAVAGDRNGGQEMALHTILDFFIINGMIPVSGGVFGANFGGTIWSGDKGAEGLQADAEGLKSMRKTVDRLMDYYQ